MGHPSVFIRLRAGHQPYDAGLPPGGAQKSLRRGSGSLFVRRWVEVRGFPPFHDEKAVEGRGTHFPLRVRSGPG